MNARVFRQRLVDQRQQVLARYYGELERAEEELDSRETEDVERSSEQWDAQVLSTLGDGDARALREIVAALRRIDDGTFGTCTACGSDINEARLVAVPAAARCIDCAAAYSTRRMRRVG